jgi:hypothetical protein
MLHGVAKVCRKQQQVLLILSLIYGTNSFVLAEILPLYQYMMHMYAKVMATSSTNKSAVSTVDGKCIWQK